MNDQARPQRTPRAIRPAMAGPRRIRAGRAGRLAVLLAACALLASAAAFAANPAGVLPSDAELEALGAVIGRIRIANGDVFDRAIEGESGPLYALANRVHRRTRRSVIRQHLLFREGDRYSRRLLDESARLLRAERYLGDASIEPVAYADGKVEVRIGTRDIWSLNPGVSFGRRGGENNFSLEIEELNFLGLGIELDLEHASNVDRDLNSIELIDRQLLGSRYRLEAGYADNSDGGSWKLGLERPFYALDTRWSVGVRLAQVEQVESFYRLGEVFDRYRREGRTGEIYYGRSRGLDNGWVRRWTFGLSQDQQRFSTVSDGLGRGLLPANRDLRYGWIGLERVEDDFAVWHNRDQMGRSEDVRMGSRLAARVGRVSQALGADRDGWIYRLEASRGLRLTATDSLLLKAELGGRREDGRDVGQLLTGAARWYHPQSERSLLFARVEVAIGRNLELDHPILLGGDSGLRGYPLRYQGGERSALLTLEQRYFTDWYPFRLFRVGAAAFVDAGRTSGEDGLGTPSLGWLTDVGVGLRLASTRASLGNVIHIDLAFPLSGGDAIDRVQLLLEARREF